ncbi:MAG: alpha/beta hydrolase, partial [Acidobacteriota bacterium]
MKRVGVVIAIVLATGLSSAAQNEDLSVLKRWVEWSNAANSLQLHLNQEAFKLLGARREAVGKLRSAADWKARQQSVRASLQKALGPFPEKTPLNAQVLGVTQRSGYRVEKIVFESIPGYFVTACLFVPDNLQGRAPAILNLIGHTDIAFRAPMYQQLILNLVEKKFIVLAVDPIGQGERLQYYDPQLKRSTVGGATTEHSYVGRQCFLTGSSLARYFTWDGIRAIDYLISRSEVDAARIGVTGISGGGTQTSYVAAIDERVAAAAPACYITGFQRLLESIGLGDAEQNFVHGLQDGIDHPDFLEVRAPRPTLVVATTRDFFSIQGARETVEEAKTAFQALGAADNLSIVEDDFGHGYTRKTREGIYAFFQKHLNNPGSSSDREIELLAAEALTVTATGQVSTSLRGETAFTLNRSVAVNLAEKLDRSRADLPAHLARAASEARVLSGYVQPEAVTRAVFRGRYARDGYNVELYALGGEGRLVIPVVLMVPNKPGRHPGLIYLHPGGKSEAASPGGEMEWFARRGYVVLSADLAGMGELGSVDTLLAYVGVQTGRSVVGIRAADIVRWGGGLLVGGRVGFRRAETTGEVS